ncbi:hypothetical protein P9578_24110 [Brevibacillus choshinensis]|uniref:hypothetical protein n=1 Tax=Brevibacillus choshinensis TaxID=54911 RepID=UPI002E1A0782|nr:hypothetical protein [Brevibacillus choshinensis]
MAARFENARVSPKETDATTTAAAPIQKIDNIDDPPTATPSIPTPTANPSCTKVLFMLSVIPDASGASERRLKFCVGPNVQAAIVQT